MDVFNSTTSVIVTRRITFHLLACVLSLLFWVVLLFLLSMRSWSKVVIRRSLQRFQLLSSYLVRNLQVGGGFFLFIYDFIILQTMLILPNRAWFFWMLRLFSSCLSRFIHTFVSANCAIGSNLIILLVSSSRLMFSIASFQRNGGHGLHWLALSWHALGVPRSTASWPFWRLALLFWSTYGTYWTLIKRVILW